MKPRIVPLGDSAVLIQFGDEIDFTINQRVHAMANLIESSSIHGIVETVPAYATLLVHYNPLNLSFIQIKNQLREKIDQVAEISSRKPRQVQVPVRYGGEYGMDLESVASYLQLSVTDVIRIHSEKIYTVYMMGFTPGF